MYGWLSSNPSPFLLYWITSFTCLGSTYPRTHFLALLPCTQFPRNFQKLFTFIIIFRTTLWTDSDRWRVKNLIFNFGWTPPFTILDRTTSVGDSFMFERENALATNCARTTYYIALGIWLFIWVVPTVIVTIPSFRRWNTFSRIGTFELCWRTLYWNGGQRLHAFSSNDFNSLTK